MRHMMNYLNEEFALQVSQISAKNWNWRHVML